MPMMSPAVAPTARAWMPAEAATPPTCAQRQQAEADGQPGVGRVQHPQDGARAGAPGLPVPQARGMQQAAAAKPAAVTGWPAAAPRPPATGRGSQRAALQPRGTCNCRPGSADIVKAGITRPAITHSIITTSASPACSARSGSMFSHPARRRESQVGRCQQHEDRTQRQVAPVAGFQQHADQHDGHPGQQHQVQQGIDHVGRPHGRQPRGQPQPRHRSQRGAARRGQARPGLAGRQQEADDHRHGKAVQHLVGVPQQRRHRRRQCHQTQQARDPVRDGEQGERGRTQVERTETQAEQRPARERELRARPAAASAGGEACGDQRHGGAGCFMAVGSEPGVRASGLTTKDAA
jgi:hypothetical protein